MLGNQSLLFLSCAIQKNIQQIFDMAFSLQGFHKKRMPFILRLLGCVLLLPCPEMMEVIGQHLVASAFFLAVSLFRGRLSDMGLDSVLLPVVVANAEIISQLHSGGFAGQSEQAGNKINGISVRLASETMETLVHLHAGILVIVKWADCQTHKAVHDKYLKIGWKARQAAFAESHKDELDSFNKAFRYLKKQGVDLNVNLDSLQAEYDKLKATHTELAGQLATAKEELQPMKDIRYWVSKVLTPEQSEIEKKPEPKHSVTERMKFLQEQSNHQPEQKTPQQKKQNMEL